MDGDLDKQDEASFLSIAAEAERPVERIDVESQSPSAYLSIHADLAIITSLR